jgi:hypothetical protein
MSRFEILFSIRYASRALERCARFWGWIDRVLKFATILSGSAAVAAVLGQHPAFSVVLGVVFAALQAIEYTLSPGSNAVMARAEQKRYVSLYAKAPSLSDKQLESAWNDASREDDFDIPEFIRRLAYNDVLLENGCDPSYAYPDAGAWRWFA